MENIIRGLSHEEAASKLKQFGPNEIRDFSQLIPLKILLRLVKKNFVIYLLLLASIISFLVGESVTGVAILLVLVVIILVTFVQEYRAETAIKALRGMIMQVSIVIRDGKEQEVPSRDLVPGDLVILRSGEKVPADCVVIEGNELQLNEAVLTGESKEIKKEAAADPQATGDSNLIFMGSFVVNGRCKGIVLHTGMNTRFGSIASMISETEKSLPLQDKVNKLARYMVVAALIISLLTGLLMASRVEVWTPAAFSGILVLVIALSVSAFPEGLPVVLVMTLAAGATRMARKNAIVNRMSIIETLGETTVICADKTGTITKGEMTVKKLFAAGKLLDVEGSGFEAKGKFLEGDKVVDIKDSQTLERLLQAATLCNDTRIERTGEDEEYRILGTSTEGALLIMAAKANVFPADLGAQRLEEVPFNSERKMMSVMCQFKGEFLVYAKGAPEVLLDKCRFYQKGDHVLPLTSKTKEEIEKVNRQLTRDSYRTIALAFKKASVSHSGHKARSSERNYREEEFVFLGIAGMEDPPREEVAESLLSCYQAGIAVKMITGDHKETALAIAHKIGLEGKVLEGEELDKMTDDELSKIVKETVIFARVRPEHKLRIVLALKNLGEIVTMTGDGVNDAPALKEAHIGVAMGKNGTDVSRSVADLTLKDDNFATIVLAIREGRTVFNNIRKFVSYQLSCNWAELSILLFGVILAPLFGWEVPLLLALQILFMNLVTDDLPAITLGFNHSSTDVMMELPRRKAEILNKEAFKAMILATTIIVSLTLMAFYLATNVLGKDVVTARTTALVTLILLEIASAFNFRSFRFPVLTRSPFINIYLFWASVISLLATLIIVYTPIGRLFSTSHLAASDWLSAIASALILLVISDRLKNLHHKIPLPVKEPLARL